MTTDIRGHDITFTICGRPIFILFGTSQLDFAYDFTRIDIRIVNLFNTLGNLLRIC